MDLHEPIPKLRGSWLTRRHGGVVIFFGVFLTICLLIRLALLVKAAHDVSWDASIFAVLGWGFLFDFAAAGWMALPWIILLTILPSRFFRGKWARASAYLLFFTMLYVLLFDAVAEWIFWGEFGTRFNFIVVDYLVYTTEVLGNIRESYPVPFILAGIFAASALVFCLVWKTGLSQAWLPGEHERMRRRWVIGAVWVAVVLVTGMAVQSDWLPPFRNNFNRELARNGFWSICAAFRNNELEYERFYETLPLEDAFAGLRQNLVEDGSVLLRPDEFDTLRYVRNPPPEQHLNIVQITVESLSSEFMGTWNPKLKITPNLDALASKSLVFTRFYATGTRTDRGMEALALSIPPTPGRSIIKRPQNENLFTLGSVLRAKGYDTAFIYGGFGYFDNMNYFFGQNGYRLIDRNAVAGDDVTFGNAWGACDEDLFRWTLREADEADTAGRPFHFFVMTTSNHRPYTFPEGRIDLPSKTSGRAGAVKYTDYAIGKFLSDAASKPWFKNTVFVIVADHCASSAGKAELPVDMYHIPLFIYAPGGQIAPGRNDTLMSQMDYAPTLLGLLNWTYPSRFFGHDVRRIKPNEAHALIGTYQKLGLLREGELTVLTPQRGKSFYSWDRAESLDLQDDSVHHAKRGAIGLYQTASHIFHHGIYRELTPGEFESCLAAGRKLATQKDLSSNTARQ
jgi:phosphoglycerol transferase MdoB-like AlkP superfamily enzyme